MDPVVNISRRVFMIDFDNYKKVCLTCKHLNKKITEEPCFSCSQSYSLWEYDKYERSNDSKDSKEE